MRLLPAAPLLFLLAAPAGAAEVGGSADFGFWYLHNNVADGAGYVADDGYGSSYVQNDYSLANFGLRLEGRDLTDASGEMKLNAFFKGRLLWNVGEQAESLAIPDETRQQIDELSVELAGLGRSFDLWAGRQTIYEAGGVGVDGVRGVYHLDGAWDLGLYGGLTNDPRNLTGYIGPSYQERLFSSDFQAFGAYVTNRGQRLRWDAALNAQLFEGSLDRFVLFSQASYYLNAVWSFSGAVDLGIAGDPGLQRAQALVTTRPTNRITNTLSYTRFVSLLYDASDASAIPVPPGVDAGWVNGGEVDTSSYDSGKEQIQIRIQERNYIFGAFQFSHRSFDGENLLKYTAGYRDPELFGSKFDLKFQTDVLDSYRGFHTLFDVLLGHEFSDGKFRLEGGALFSANERDRYEENLFVSSAGETEKEYSLRFNAYAVLTSKVNAVLNYALHHEIDVVSGRQTVWTHDLYAATSFAF